MNTMKRLFWSVLHFVPCDRYLFRCAKLKYPSIFRRLAAYEKLRAYLGEAYSNRGSQRTIGSSILSPPGFGHCQSSKTLLAQDGGWPSPVSKRYPFLFPDRISLPSSTWPT